MAVQKYGLDLGTGTIKIYKNGQGVVLKERNMIAIRRKTEMVAFGEEAYAMYERAPENIRVYGPVKNGVIAGLHDMKVLLDLFLRKIKCANGFIRSNEFYFAVPSDITEVEKRAFFDLAMSSEFKTKDLYIVEKPVATAFGEGVDVLHTPGVMVIDFGADTVEISVLALGGIVASRLLKIGGNAMNEAICESVKEKYNLLIGIKTAESLKLELGSALNTVHSFKKVLGRDLISGLPAEVKTILTPSSTTICMISSICGYINGILTPKGLCVAAWHLRICSRNVSGCMEPAPSKPSPPALLTADAKRQPLHQTIPP